MKDLAEKNYPKVLGGQTMDLTVLFVPIEGALAAALSIDPSLQTDAWAKRITFASPNTLMMMLKVVERLWTRDRLQKQVGVIADEASKLVDSLVTFLEDFKKIEDKLKAVSQVYGDARNRLYESSQSVVARAGRLVKAGARGKKALPDELQSDPDVLELPLLAQED
jgi:DNA recombination protein RmuC